jgi:transposase-like protein
MKRRKRNHLVTFKVQVALATITGDKTLAESAEEFSIHPIQITDWKQQLLVRDADEFGPAKPTADTLGSLVISNPPGTTYGSAEAVQQTGATSGGLLVEHMIADCLVRAPFGSFSFGQYLSAYD